MKKLFLIVLITSSLFVYMSDRGLITECKVRSDYFQITGFHRNEKEAKRIAMYECERRIKKKNLKVAVNCVDVD